jgi:hypothetical protein
MFRCGLDGQGRAGLLRCVAHRQRACHAGDGGHGAVRRNLIVGGSGRDRDGQAGPGRDPARDSRAHTSPEQARDGRPGTGRDPPRGSQAHTSPEQTRDGRPGTGRDPPRDSRAHTSRGEAMTARPAPTGPR